MKPAPLDSPQEGLQLLAAVIAQQVLNAQLNQTGASAQSNRNEGLREELRLLEQINDHLERNICLNEQRRLVPVKKEEEVKTEFKDEDFGRP
jgi:hypothetical protein